MPVRLLAKPPGEFMRDHLVAAGGMDYPQAIYKAYKEHLKSVGMKDGCSRSSWSRYIWLANRLELIEFDHAEAPTRWDGIVDGVDVPRTYRRESRPQAPSPRHYYRILDPNDPRWIRLEASYRESIGFEVPPPALKPVPKPPKEKAPPPPKKPPKPKPPRKPRVVKPKPPTAEEKVQPYEERIGLILATLSELETAPSLETVSDIENRLLELGEEVLESAEKAKGVERTLLSTLSLRWRSGIEEIPLLRSSVQRYLVARTPSEKQRAAAALRAAIRVVKENVTPTEAEVYVEPTKVGMSLQELLDKWEDRDKNVLSLEKDLQSLDPDVYDLNYVDEAISDYRGLERSDFESQEEYREGRQEAWDTILEEIENLAPEED